MNVEDIPGKLREGFDSLRLGLTDLRTQLLSRRVLLELHDGGLRGQVLGRRADRLELPLPPGICRQGQPREIEAIGDLLGDLFLELGLPAARVIACLPLAAACWRVVRWPRSQAPENQRAELRLLAPDLGLPWPLNDVYLEVEPLPADPSRSLVVASPRTLVDSWVEVFEVAGLQLQRLLPAQACEWQMLADRGLQQEPGEQWFLEVEATRSRLWLVAEGIPVADWSLPGNPEPDGLDPELGQALQRVLQFWRQRGGGARRRWWLYGDEQRLEGLQPQLANLLAGETLQRLDGEGLAPGSELRLTGLMHCMGWR